MALLWWITFTAAVSLLLASSKVYSQSDTTFFDYSFFNGNERDLIYQGDAHIANQISTGEIVPAGQTFIRLTSSIEINSRPWPLDSSVGRVLYSPPVRLWDSAGRRQATFQTVITGAVNLPGYSHRGDGLAFFIAPAVNSTIPEGSTGGHMGLYDSSGTSPVPLLAVELDVYPNIWDPNYRHIGININNRTSASFARWEAGGLGQENELRVTYDPHDRLVRVVSNVTNGWPVDFPLIATVEHSIDLKTILPEWVQLGIGASTGSAIAIHDVRSWFFVSFMVPDVTSADDTVIPDPRIRQYV